MYVKNYIAGASGISGAGSAAGAGVSEPPAGAYASVAGASDAIASPCIASSSSK